LPIVLLQLIGAHSGEAIAKVVIAIFKKFNITVGKLSYFILNNAYNNNIAITTVASKIGFDATKRRLACGPYTINLIGQMLLWGKEKESYNNNKSKAVNEAKNIDT
jgi:hypothetical protein